MLTTRCSKGAGGAALSSVEGQQKTRESPSGSFPSYMSIELPGGNPTVLLNGPSMSKPSLESSGATHWQEKAAKLTRSASRFSQGGGCI